MTAVNVIGNDELAALLGPELPEHLFILDASHPVSDWPDARATLLEAFAHSQEAAVAEAPIVYLVHGDDLLGRRGPTSAMVATALLSGARTAAIELVRKGAVVNVIAVGDDTDSALVARWISYLVAADGPTGELIRLDAGHLGKALP